MKRKKIIGVAVAFLFVVLSWMLYENKALGVTHYQVDCSLRPELNGFTIVHISDLHNEEFGKDQQKILQKIKEQKPDMIAVTGDLIDCRHPDVDTAMEFINGVVEIAEVYYVPGNHERWASGEYVELCKRMLEAGVQMIANEQKVIEYNGAEILCMGVEDPEFYDVIGGSAEAEVIRQKVQTFELSEEKFTVLLSHRPELFEVYKEAGFDIVLTGHAHGGQFRLPFFGGLAAPNQGLFPKYDAGLFKEDDTHMIVSRGIGNSIIPIRFNNPPEIVVVELNSESVL